MLTTRLYKVVDIRFITLYGIILREVYNEDNLPRKHLQDIRSRKLSLRSTFQIQKSTCTTWWNQGKIIQKSVHKYYG